MPDPDPTDGAIVARVRAGDTDAFLILVERYQRRLRAALAFRCLSAEEAEEFTQDAFVQAYARLATFQPDAAFFPWLKTIALNALRLELRRRERRGRHGRAYLQQLLLENATDDEDVVEERRRSALGDCLGELSDDHARLLRRRYADDAGLDELARAAGASVGAMKVRLFRLRESLRDCIERRIAAAGT